MQPHQHWPPHSPPHCSPKNLEKMFITSVVHPIVPPKYGKTVSHQRRPPHCTPLSTQNPEKQFLTSVVHPMAPHCPPQIWKNNFSPALPPLPPLSPIVPSQVKMDKLFLTSVVHLIVHLIVPPKPKKLYHRRCPSHLPPISVPKIWKNCALLSVGTIFVAYWRYSSLSAPCFVGTRPQVLLDPAQFAFTLVLEDFLGGDEHYTTIFWTPSVVGPLAIYLYFST